MVVSVTPLVVRVVGSVVAPPFAVVVVAGTVTAALVTLVVLPVVYAAACKLRAAFFAWRDAKDRAEATA